MKTISDYTIYCTEEQTRKAFELGAPIKPKIDLFTPYLKETPHTNIPIDGEDAILIIPTAEQMIAWLEEQGFRFEVEYCTMYCMMIHINDTYVCSPICAKSRKEATLATIDAALELINNNK